MKKPRMLALLLVTVFVLSSVLIVGCGGRPTEPAGQFRVGETYDMTFSQYGTRVFEVLAVMDNGWLYVRDGGGRLLWVNTAHILFVDRGREDND